MPFGASLGELLMVGIVGVLTVAIPVVVIVLLVQAGRRPPDPRTTLADRLARGEITREEFDVAMRALGLSEGRR